MLRSLLRQKNIMRSILIAALFSITSTQHAAYTPYQKIAQMVGIHSKSKSMYTFAFAHDYKTLAAIAVAVGIGFYGCYKLCRHPRCALYFANVRLDRNIKTSTAIENKILKNVLYAKFKAGLNKDNAQATRENLQKNNAIVKAIKTTTDRDAKAWENIPAAAAFVNKAQGFSHLDQQIILEIDQRITLAQNYIDSQIAR